ncbi:hypothetical protein FXO38_12322 [Capsicum annuum]|nr:hypothetical protein FXO38_12322 [Capsicum annuum]
MISNQLIVDICADHPNSFWNRKEHIVILPYEKHFSEDKIPTKSRSCQMNTELVEFCKREIDNLLQKGLIKSSKSPWLCTAFYINNVAEKELVKTDASNVGYGGILKKVNPHNNIECLIRFHSGKCLTLDHFMDELACGNIYPLVIEHDAMTQLSDNVSYMLCCTMMKMQLWQAETLFLQKDTYLNYSQALSYTSQTLSQNLHGLRKRSSIKRMSTKLFYWFQENWKRIWVLALWILLIIELFLWNFYTYKQKSVFKVMGYCLLTAKGAVEPLKFNMALILLLLQQLLLVSYHAGNHLVAAFKVLWHLILACDFEVRQTLDKVILTLKDLNMGEYPGLNDRWMDVISSQGSSLLSLDRLGSDVTDPGLTYLKDCKNMQALNLNYCDQIIDHRVENISSKYSFSSNVHGNRYGVIEAKEGVSNSLIMPAVITPGDMLDLSTVLFKSRIIFIGTLINSAVA